MPSDLIVSESISLGDAMKLIDSLGSQGLVVVDGNKCLVGTLTDGDIRRSIILGKSLSTPIGSCCNRNAFTVNSSTSESSNSELMNRLMIHILPIIDSNRKVIRVQLQKNTNLSLHLLNSVLIMAGGRGTRLGEITKKVPKPLVEIGNQTLLEILIKRIASHGFRNIFISVHYLASEIIAHIGSGSQFGVQINYINEDKPLGTAGAISLMGDKDLKNPIIVTNADIIHNLNFREFLEGHINSKALFTVAAARYPISIPFGVIDADGTKLIKIREKPTENKLINAGLYVLNAEVANLIPKNSTFDMTELISEATRKGFQVNIQEIRGYWKDIGDIDSLNEARRGEE